MLERGQAGLDIQKTDAPLNNREGGHRSSEAHRRAAALLFWSMTLDGLEAQRIAAENRIRSLVQADVEPDPVATALRDSLATLEHRAELALGRELRKHPYGPWVADTVGIGRKQGARLLAAMGDPLWNERDDRARRDVAELWAYCGFVPGQRRQKGVRSNWNAAAKMRAFLCAEKCIAFDGKPNKNGKPNPLSPYRPVYDSRRALTAQTHPDWTAGHSHNDALRIVAKAILEDLFNFGRAMRSSHDATTCPPAQVLAGAIEASPKGRYAHAPATLGAVAA